MGDKIMIKTDHEESKLLEDETVASSMAPKSEENVGEEAETENAYGAAIEVNVNKGDQGTLENPGLPAKARTAFELFCIEQEHVAAGDHPGVGTDEWKEMIAKTYEAMSEDHQKKYVELAEVELLEVYRRMKLFVDNLDEQKKLKKEEDAEIGNGSEAPIEADIDMVLAGVKLGPIPNLEDMIRNITSSDQFKDSVALFIAEMANLNQ